MHGRKPEVAACQEVTWPAKSFPDRSYHSYPSYYIPGEANATTPNNLKDIGDIVKREKILTMRKIKRRRVRI